jgi:CheY-like chemotaxis protein
MPNNDVIVILEGTDCRNLARLLPRWGYSIIVVDNMMNALYRVDHHDLAAVIMDGNEVVDALEFVLNVREIDETLPIIIIRPSMAEDVRQVLRERPHVYFVSTKDDDFHPRVKSTLAEAKR